MKDGPGAASLRILIIGSSEGRAAPVLDALRQSGIELLTERIETADLSAAASATTGAAWDLVLDTRAGNALVASAVPPAGLPGGTTRPPARRGTAPKKRAADAALHSQQEPGISPTEETFRTLYKTLPCGVMVIDGGGAIVHVNDAMEQLYGISMAELSDARKANVLLRPLREDGSPMPPGGWPAIRTLRTGRAVRNCTVGIHHPDGSLRWVQIDAVPLPTADGEPAHVIATALDVTAHRDAQERLLRLAAIVESTDEAVMAFDMSGIIHTWNPAAALLFGFDAAEIVGQPVALLQQPAQREGLSELLRLIGAGRHVRNHDLLYVARDGRCVTLDFSASPLRDAGGAVVACIVVARDISEWRQAQAALRASEERYRTLFEDAQDVICTFDLEGHITSVNRAGVQLTGYSREELIGLRMSDVMTPAEQAVATSRISRRLAGESLEASIHEITTKDGRTVTLEVSTSLILAANGPAGAQAIARDITERRRTEAALRESEARTRAIFDGVAIGIARCDLAGAIVESNSTLQAMLGYSADELNQLRFRDITFPEDLSTPLEQFGLILAGQRDQYQLEKRYARRDGSLLWGHINVSLVRDADGIPLFTICTVEDVTARKEAEAALKHQALHDSLTGLPNRTLLRDRLQEAILAAERRQAPFALLFLDLDRFKEVNDTFGHQAGDNLLQEAGPRLQGVLRAADTVARLGGDEFAVLLPGADTVGALEAAQTITTAFERPFVVEDQRVGVGASIGVAVFPEHGRDAETLMRHADVAMYLAKQTGDDVAVYSAERDGHDPFRLALLTELRQAFDEDELRLYYQPVVRLVDGRTVHVEALARWQHPQRGLLPPDQFVPLAEHTGLITRFTHWTLDAALRAARGWQDRGLSLSVAVNLSVRALHDPRLLETIAGLLAKHGMPARRLKLELTESAIMVDPAHALTVLQSLHEMGVHLSIDDFGTGYSSLAYLKHLPVDEIKIDKSFVLDMAVSGKDLAIVRSTVELARNLGLQVVAEGVEDALTMERLADLGCDLAQGYHISHPLPESALLAWLTTRASDNAASA